MWYVLTANCEPVARQRSRADSRMLKRRAACAHGSNGGGGGDTSSRLSSAQPPPSTLRRKPRGGSAGGRGHSFTSAARFTSTFSDVNRRDGHASATPM